MRRGEQELSERGRAQYQVRLRDVNIFALTRKYRVDRVPPVDTASDGEGALHFEFPRTAPESDVSFVISWSIRIASTHW